MYEVSRNLIFAPTWRERRRPHHVLGVIHWIGSLVLICGACLGACSVAQAQSSMYEEPYHTIYHKDGTRIKALSVDTKKDRNTVFYVDVEHPDEQRSVPRSQLRGVLLFHSRLLREADALIDRKRFDKAFEVLQFVNANYADQAAQRLELTLNKLLEQEAKALAESGKLERASLLLDEAIQRSPGSRNVASDLQGVLQQRFARMLRDEDYQSARRLYEISEQKYRRKLPKLFESWQTQLEKIGQDILAQGNRHLETGEYRDAYLASRRLQEIWPQTEGAATLLSQATQRYPLVRVGVLDGTEIQGEAPIHFSWAQRRRHRLQTRDLFELTAVGPDGGEYECLVGQPRFEADNRAFTISVDSAIGQGLTGVQLSQLMLDKGDLQRPDADPAWASLAKRIGAQRVVDAAVELQRPFLRTQSLLDIPLSRLNSEQLRNRFAPYKLSRSDENEAQFLVNADYIQFSATQPREVIERRFETPNGAVTALKRGEIDLIDRIFPADFSQLRREENLELVRYRIPSLHVLVPNFDRDFVGNRLFRRGIAYSIDRGKILKRDLLGGADIVGCQLISGPFSPGIVPDDPIAYGYERRIEPRPYDPRHAKTLIKLAEVEMAMMANENDSEIPTLKELVIVHPAGEIARIACNEIVEDLSIIGVSARLEALPVGACMPDHDDWDLVYLDYVLPEPLADAGEFLAYEGFARCRSPHLNLAIRQLQRVVSWKEAGERLRVIHQLCFDNTSIIPLWQLADHMAHRSGLSGVVREPITVFQNVEGWTQN